MSQTPCPTCGTLNGPAMFLELSTSPRFLDLLSTNIPPHDAEVDDLRQMVRNSSALVQSLQDHINKVQDTLSALQSMHDIASRRLADAKRILHPIRSLPRDIFSEISLSCTPIADERGSEALEYGPKFDTLCPRNYPWNLSHVCRAWRQITLSLPRLWSTIYLNFERYDCLSHRQIIYKSALLFERSANLDLSLTLASDAKGIARHPLMGYLEASTMRWRILRCRIPTSSLQALAGCTFPLLEDLGIDYRPGTDPIPTVDVFSHASNVRNLEFYNSDYRVESYSVLGAFPWSTVKRLYCDTCLRPALCSVLRQSTGIEELTLVLSIFDDNCQDEVVTLVALRRLEIHEDLDSGCLSQFLKALRAPFLRHLTLTFVPGQLIFFHELGSHPDLGQITTLRITCSMAKTFFEDEDEYLNRNPDILLKFLHLLIGVEEFQLADDNVPIDFLRAYVLEEAESAVVLPSLRTLDIHECEFMDDDEDDTYLDVLLALAESRSTTRISVGLCDRPCNALHTFRLPKICDPFQHAAVEDKDRWTDVASEMKIICS